MSDILHSREHTDTKSLILQAAVNEFFEKGFDGARTTSIAERAGITHAMLHYYFRTKENLFDKVMESISGQLRSIICDFIDKEDLPLADRIEAGMRTHFEFLCKNPLLPYFLINELHRGNSSARQYIHQNKEAAESIRNSLQRDIDALAAKGECKRVDALQLMLDIFSLNIFMFIGSDILNILFSSSEVSREELLRERLEQNIQTVFNKLRP
mgnify:CR=1 FL=1